MVEAEATQENDAPEGAPAATQEIPAPESAPAAPISDWSELRGFQVVASSSQESEASQGRDPAIYAVELGKELEARAARFAQSVDDSIVLSSDGLFRWLGDPVARLVGGDDILKPRAVLLADDALSAESRASVETRLTLWIAAHVQKVLGPLTALADNAQVAESARDLAQRIVQALGVLERDRVRQQVKALDQNARAVLRKLGVRFGAAYIFVPALLKPGARALCAQLWSLRRGVEPGAERLLAFAAAGRTSFAAEGALSPETYRVSGFRLCGERVVRVDIVERLTDLIRAAIPDHMRPGTRPPSEAYGFVVTPQMTSLTGCAGDAFAAILRSLGYESVKVKKSEHEAATRKAPTEPLKPVVAEEAAAPSDAEAESETREAEEARASHEGVEAPATAELEGSAETEAVAETEAAVETTEVASESDAVVEQVAEPIVEAVAVETPETAHSAEAEPVAAEEGAAHVESVETQVDGEATTDIAPAAIVEDEEIEIWRPAPRQPRPPQRQAHAPGGQPEAARGPRHGRDHRRHHHQTETAAQPAAAEAAPAPAPEGEAPRRHEFRRDHRPEGRRDERAQGGQGYRGQRDGKGPPREDRKPAEGHRPSRDGGHGQRDGAHGQPRKEPRPQTIDPDSPFAKLLALKPLLERKDKRT